MKRTIFIAVILFFLDAFCLNNYFIALLVACIVGARIIKFLIATDENTIPKQQLIKGCIYVCMIILIITANGINNIIAKSRAYMLIVCCEKYKSRYGEYPQKLPDLVPEFIENIPNAKYTLFDNKFMYQSGGRFHSLNYAVIPPFGRSVYYFEEHKWIYSG